MTKPKIAHQIDDLVTYTKRLIDPSAKEKVLFCFGPTGVGKSLMVRETLRSHGVPWEVIGNATKVGIIETMQADPDGFHLFDDVHEPFTNVSMLNLLKNAFDQQNAPVAHVVNAGEKMHRRAGAKMRQG